MNFDFKLQTWCIIAYAQVSKSKLKLVLHICITTLTIQVTPISHRPYKAGHNSHGKPCASWSYIDQFQRFLLLSFYLNMEVQRGSRDHSYVLFLSKFRCLDSIWNKACMIFEIFAGPWKRIFSILSVIN